jgi:phospholipid/cholesterol/gamma-HCH transport system substrate-binding protein
VRWAQLRVGLTVVFASITLAVLIFLMTGTGGLFTPKMYLHVYFDNASGLRPGAPVRLQGVDIGNVTAIRVVPHKEPYPVEVTMKVSTKYIREIRTDSIATLTTAGVLGEVFVDINSTQATGPEVKNGDVLKMQSQPDLNDVVRSTQSSLQNLDVLIHRIDRIVSFIESGNGSIGKMIYDPALYNQLNASVKEFQGIMQQVSSGQGSLGKLLTDDQLYNKANDTVDKLNRIATELEQGQGTAGKFLKDPALYNNANQTIAKANRLMDDINAGKGTLGMLAKDEAFRAKLNDTITNLNALSAKLESGQGTAGKFINDPTLYNNTNQMLLETRNLLQAVREDPKKYLTIRLRVF